MNKIFKVVWSKARNAYVVVSETAKNTTKGCSSKKLIAMLIATGVLSAGVSGVGYAYSYNPDEQYNDGSRIILSTNASVADPSHHSVVINSDGANNSSLVKTLEFIGNQTVDEDGYITSYSDYYKRTTTIGRYVDGKLYNADGVLLCDEPAKIKPVYKQRYVAGHWEGEGDDRHYVSPYYEDYLAGYTYDYNTLSTVIAKGQWSSIIGSSGTVEANGQWSSIIGSQNASAKSQWSAVINSNELSAGGLTQNDMNNTVIGSTHSWGTGQGYYGSGSDGTPKVLSFNLNGGAVPYNVTEGIVKVSSPDYKNGNVANKEVAAAGQFTSVISSKYSSAGRGVSAQLATVIGSADSMAGYSTYDMFNSVISSLSSFAGGYYSSVLNSDSSIAGSDGGSSIHTMVMNSKDSAAFGQEATVIGSANSAIIGGTYGGNSIMNTIIGSDHSTVNGLQGAMYNTIVGSTNSSTKDMYATIMGSHNSSATNMYTNVIGSKDAKAAGQFSTVIASGGNLDGSTNQPTKVELVARRLQTDPTSYGYGYYFKNENGDIVKKESSYNNTIKDVVVYKASDGYDIQEYTETRKIWENGKQVDKEFHYFNVYGNKPVGDINADGFYDAVINSSGELNAQGMYATTIGSSNSSAGYYLNKGVGDSYAQYSTVIGSETSNAVGQIHSLIINASNSQAGNSNTVAGTYTGYNTVISSNNSKALGQQYTTVIGSLDSNAGQPANYSTEDDPATYKGWNTVIGSNKSNATGLEYSTVIGSNQGNATAQYSTVISSNKGDAVGYQSTVIGAVNAVANGQSSTIIGSYTSRPEGVRTDGKLTTLIGVDTVQIINRNSDGTIPETFIDAMSGNTIGSTAIGSAQGVIYDQYDTMLGSTNATIEKLHATTIGDSYVDAKGQYSTIIGSKGDQRNHLVADGQHTTIIGSAGVSSKRWTQDTSYDGEFTTIIGTDSSSVEGKGHATMIGSKVSYIGSLNGEAYGDGSQFATIIGSVNSNATGQYATVMASDGAKALSMHSMILNTQNGTVADGYLTNVIGATDGVKASGYLSTAIGAHSSKADGQFATAIGSQNSQASGSFATVVGSQASKAGGTQVTVVGSIGSQASGNEATVIGSTNSNAGVIGVTETVETHKYNYQFWKNIGEASVDEATGNLLDTDGNLLATAGNFNAYDSGYQGTNSVDAANASIEKYDWTGELKDYVVVNGQALGDFIGEEKNTVTNVITPGVSVHHSTISGSDNANIKADFSTIEGSSNAVIKENSIFSKISGSSASATTTPNYISGTHGLISNSHDSSIDGQFGTIVGSSNATIGFAGTPATSTEVTVGSSAASLDATGNLVDANGKVLANSGAFTTKTVSYNYNFWKDANEASVNSEGNLVDGNGKVLATAGNFETYETGYTGHNSIDAEGVKINDQGYLEKDWVWISNDFTANNEFTYTETTPGEAGVQPRFATVIGSSQATVNSNYSAIIASDPVTINEGSDFSVISGSKGTEAKPTSITGEFGLISNSDGAVINNNTHGTIIGSTDSSVTGDYGVVIGGKESTVSADYALVFGANASATKEGGVAIGQYSQANVDKGVVGVNPLSASFDGTSPEWKSTAAAVAVGGVDTEGNVITRQITGVAAGTALTDAVNVAQLNALKQYIDEKTFNFVGDAGDNPLTYTGKDLTVEPETTPAVPETSPETTPETTPAVPETTPSETPTEQPAEEPPARIANSNTLNVLGGAKADLTEGNIGVIAEEDEDGKKTLNIKLKKDLNLPDGSVTINNGTNVTVFNGAGLTINPVSNINNDGTVIDPKLTVQVTQNNISMGGNIIHNVAEGVEGSDAATVSQLKYTTNSIEADKDTSAQTNVANKYTVKETVVDKDGNPIKDADGKELTKEIGTIVDTDTTYDFTYEAGAEEKGVINITNTKDDTKWQILAGNGITIDGNNNTKQFTIKVGGPDADFLEAEDVGMGFKGDVGDKINVGNNGTLNIVGGITDESKLTEKDNIGVVAKDGALKVRLAKDVDLGDGSLTLSKGGKTVKIEGDNVDMGGNQIHNVAAGTAPTDAVNVSQLRGLEQNFNNRVNKVGAHAAALAGLHPLDFDPDDKLNFAAGYGHYHGESAGAIGAFYRPDDKTMFAISGTTGSGEHMYNASISFSLDRSDRPTRSKTAMARDILDLKEQVAQLTNLVHQLTGPTSGRDMFPDVPENHWAYEYVKGLVDDGILVAYPHGLFDGERPGTRYEFAAMLFRAMNKGIILPNRIAEEFAPEIGRFRVDRVHGEDDSNSKIERIRVNGDHNYGRDHYGSKNPQPVTSRGPQYPESERIAK